MKSEELSTLKITKREAMILSSSLQTFKTRLRCNTKWRKRKRLNTLRERLAVSVTIGDKEEECRIRGLIQKIQINIQEREKLTNEIHDLQTKVKEVFGINEERIKT